MQFESVINGILKYMDREIFVAMNDWQEVLARIAVGRIAGNAAKLKSALMENTFIRTFAIIDENGNVDIENLMEDLRRQICIKGKVDISIPMFGKFSFTEADIDKLKSFIMEA